MFIKTLKSATAALALMSSTAFASPNHMIVYLPVEADGAGAKTAYTSIIDVLSLMEPSTRLEVIANPGTQQIFDIKTPSDMPAHPDWRRNFFQQPITALQTYARAAFESGQTAKSAPLNQVGLQDVISILSRRAVESPEVIIIGSPRDNVANDLDNNTVTRFPNDKFLDLPVQVSRFGTGGVEDSLNGMRVHVCLMDDGFVDPRHPEMLQRYTSLRLEAMGGVLATWSADPKECIRRALAERSDGARDFERNLLDTEPAYYDVENVVLTVPTDLNTQVELLQDLPVSADVKTTMAAQIKAGSLQLVSVKLYDTDAEDGDAVLIQTDDASFEVSLTHAHQQVTLPVVDGKVTMIGLRDGQGGITVGIETADGSKSLTPVMSVGQKISIPFFSN